MALGAALATGKPQAYAVVPGPGLLNPAPRCSPPIRMNAPVLALIGQIPDADIGRDLGHLHEIRDQAGIIARLVDHSAPHPHARARRRAWSPRRSASMASRPARPGRAANARSTSGASAAPVTPQAPLPLRRAARSTRTRSAGGEAARRGEESADRLRRRRAGRIRGGAPRSPPCCRRRCWAIAAAAACSTAAIRSASRCRSAATCGARPMWCSASARGC